MYTIRPEQPGDVTGVRAVHAACFPTTVEARLLVSPVAGRGRGAIRLRWLAPLALALSLGTPSLCAQPGDSLAKAIGKALVEEHLVGATWSLVSPAGTTVGAAGLRDADRGTPMSADDRVQVGSVAKTLTAVGVLRLVTAGRVALDAPVGRYLPDIPIGNPWEASSPLLVRHLLDHTSGLDDARLWQVFTLRADPAAPLRAGLVRLGRTVLVRPHTVYARWASAVAGALGLLYLLIVGGVRGARSLAHGTWRSEPLCWPAACLAALLLAPALYLLQPFLAIGDATPANVAIAVLTGALPFTLFGAAVLRVRAGLRAAMARLDLLTLAAGLQWCIVLASRDLVPLALWR